MRRTFTGSWGSGTGVRQLMREACQTGAEVTLESLLPDSGLHDLLRTRIERVRDEEVVIAPPVAGSSSPYLKRLAPYRMSFHTRRGRASGQTRVLGSILLGDSGTGPSTGFRLAMPREIHVTDPQDELALLLGRDMVLEGELHILGRNGPLVGLVAELTPSGVHLRCRSTLPDLHRGQKAQLRLDLPEPTGNFTEWCSIAAVEADPESNAFIVGVSFEKRSHAIENAFRIARQRRSA